MLGAPSAKWTAMGACDYRDRMYHTTLSKSRITSRVNGVEQHSVGSRVTFELLCLVMLWWHSLIRKQLG